MPPVVELNINKNTCGNWLPKYIIDILKKYPQTNFQEWELLQIHHVNEPKKVAVNMVSKFWHPYSDPWGRKMCDWTIGNQSYTAKDGNVVNHGKHHNVQLPSTKIWNTTVSGQLVRLHAPIKSYFVKKPYSIK